jgi:hypothetical protein
VISYLPGILFIFSDSAPYVISFLLYIFAYVVAFLLIIIGVIIFLNGRKAVNNERSSEPAEM